MNLNNVYVITDIDNKIQFDFIIHNFSISNKIKWSTLDKNETSKICIYICNEFGTRLDFFSWDTMEKNIIHVYDKKNVVPINNLMLNNVNSKEYIYLINL